MRREFNPEQQMDWEDIIDECSLSVNAICKDFEFSRQSFVKWLSCDRVPQQKNLERMIEAMRKIKEEKKLPFHQSYGYATREQIEKLKGLGLGPDRDRILNQIAQQNKLMGKKR